MTWLNKNLIFLKIWCSCISIELQAHHSCYTPMFSIRLKHVFWHKHLHGKGPKIRRKEDMLLGVRLFRILPKLFHWKVSINTFKIIDDMYLQRHSITFYYEYILVIISICWTGPCWKWISNTVIHQLSKSHTFEATLERCWSHLFHPTRA